MIDLFQLYSPPSYTREDTSFVCDNCGLPYSQHNFAGGSMVKVDGSYICNGYSQRKQKRVKELSDAASNNQ